MRLRDVPDLTYSEYTAQPTKFVIDGIEVSTKPKWHGDTDLVRYTCLRGSSVNESALMTEEVAMTVSKLKAAEQNEKHRAEPEQIRKDEVGSLELQDARFDEFKNGLWSSWYAFRTLAERLEEWAEAHDDGDRRNVGEELREILAWDVRSKAKGGHKSISELEAVIQAAEALAASEAADPRGLIDALKTALEVMPQFARASLAVDSVDDLEDAFL